MASALSTIVNRFGGVVLEDNANYTNRFQIPNSSGAKMYTIAQTKKNGIWSCSCLGFIRHRHCKHMTAMMPALSSLPSPGNTRSVGF